jgi:DNA modification methylase
MISTGANWTLVNGDSCEQLPTLAADSVDLSVYSPPFMSLYTYTASEHDIGNCSTEAEFFEHFGFLQRELLRVTKPGRLTCCHVAQVPAMLARDGYIGMKDFRGKTIVAFEENGWIYQGEACIDKDPQAQAIRTHSKGLLFVQLRKDASWLRPAMADYILVFRKPGENAVAIKPDLTHEEWIEWARPIWYGISESDTLQAAPARENEDERHICPLQLGTIERCIRLWSNPGELVLSPFAGIGSEGYEAVRLGRRYWGCELKPSYARVAVRNLQTADTLKTQGGLFDAEAAEAR